MIPKQLFNYQKLYTFCNVVEYRKDVIMKYCNLVKTKRMRTMKLSVCCYVTRKDTRANFCFGCYHLNFMNKP